MKLWIITLLFISSNAFGAKGDCHKVGEDLIHVNPLFESLSIKNCSKRKYKRSSEKTCECIQSNKEKFPVDSNHKYDYEKIKKDNQVKIAEKAMEEFQKSLLTISQDIVLINGHYNLGARAKDTGSKCSPKLKFKEIAKKCNKDNTNYQLLLGHNESTFDQVIRKMEGEIQNQLANSRQFNDKGLLPRNHQNKACLITDLEVQNALWSNLQGLSTTVLKELEDYANPDIAPLDHITEKMFGAVASGDEKLTKYYQNILKSLTKVQYHPVLAELTSNYKQYENFTTRIEKPLSIDKVLGELNSSATKSIIADQLEHRCDKTYEGLETFLCEDSNNNMIGDIKVFHKTVDMPTISTTDENYTANLYTYNLRLEHHCERYQEKKTSEYSTNLELIKTPQPPITKDMDFIKMSQSFYSAPLEETRKEMCQALEGKTIAEAKKEQGCEDNYSAICGYLSAYEADEKKKKKTTGKVVLLPEDNTLLNAFLDVQAEEGQSNADTPQLADNEPKDKKGVPKKKVKGSTSNPTIAQGSKPVGTNTAFNASQTRSNPSQSDAYSDTDTSSTDAMEEVYREINRRITRVSDDLAKEKKKVAKKMRSKKFHRQKKKGKIPSFNDYQEQYVSSDYSSPEGTSWELDDPIDEETGGAVVADEAITRGRSPASQGGASNNEVTRARSGGTYYASTDIHGNTFKNGEIELIEHPNEDGWIKQDTITEVKLKGHFTEDLSTLDPEKLVLWNQDQSQEVTKLRSLLQSKKSFIISKEGFEHFRVLVVPDGDGFIVKKYGKKTSSQEYREFYQNVKVALESRSFTRKLQSDESLHVKK
jgi:hypothetical protein